MGIIVLAGVILVVTISIATTVLQYVNVCDPNEVLIYSGANSTDHTGKKTGYRVEFGGYHLRNPLYETVDRMDLRVMPIEISVGNAYSEGGIPLNISAIANVKVSADPGLVRNAVERFLGTPRAEIERVCRETLEGNLRGIVAKMTPEQVNHDRMMFAENIKQEVHGDLAKLGLEVDTFQITTVHDNVQYLDSVGRTAISQVLKEAELAESDSKRMAAQAEAEADSKVRVAEQKADLTIKQKTNEMDRLKNELEGKVLAEIERTEAAAREAKAQSESKLQEVRTALEGLRLQADVVLPAQSRQEAESLKAIGQAALIAEQGRATAEVMKIMHQALAQAGDDAMNIFMLQKIDTIVEQLVQAVEKVKVGSVTLIDSGDGKALAAYVSAYPMMVGSIMRQLKEILGLDIEAALKRSGPARGTAAALVAAGDPEVSGAAQVAVLAAAPAVAGASTPAADSSAGGPPLAPANDSPATAAAQATGANLPDLGVHHHEHLTPPDALALLVMQLSRERAIGKPERRLFAQMGQVLGLTAAQAETIVSAGMSAPKTPLSSDQKPFTPQKYYAQAYALARLDQTLSGAERDVLDRLAKALNIEKDVQAKIETAVDTAQAASSDPARPGATPAGPVNPTASSPTKA